MHDLVYRHTDDMIHKLESAGLGYHVKTDESDDRLGMNSSSSKLFFLLSLFKTRRVDEFILQAWHDSTSTKNTECAIP